MTRFDKNISTGWDNTANAWTPPGSPDDEWVWVDAGTGNTHPAIIAGPPGSPPAAPISILGVHPFRLRYCLGLPAGCLAERIEITVASANPDPAGIKVYFNSQLIASGPGTPGVSALITSGFVSNNDCLEIEVNQDYPVAVTATVSGTCGCGTVSGIKFDDRNRDGIKGTSEAGLANWLITFTDHTGNVIGSSLTGIAGTYQFGPMFAGTYAVCEVQQGGWFPTTPSGGCHAAILLAPGGAVSGVNFGNYPADYIRWTGGTGGTLMIIWDGGGTFHAAPNVAGPYEPVTGATSPFQVPTGDAPMRYFRVTWP